MKPIKIIIISNDTVFKNKMAANFKNENTDVDIITHSNSMHIFKYLETNDFKVIILKPECSFGLDDINRLGTLERQGEKMKILLFQKEHKKETNELNNETLNYLKKNVNAFKTIQLDQFIF